MKRESHLRFDPVLELARRGTVRLAFWGGTALAVVAVLQIMAGQSLGYETLAAALVTVVLATVMLRQERPNVITLLALIAATAIASDISAGIRGATAYVAGVGSEVVVMGLGLLAVFVAREKPWRVAVGFLLAAVLIVLVNQATLNGWTLEMLSDVVLVVAVIGTVMYLVVRALESLVNTQTRFSDLARLLPVATFEFDAGQLMVHMPALTKHQEATEEVEEFVTQVIPLVRLSYTNRVAEDMAESFGTWSEMMAGPNGSRVRNVAASMARALIAGEVSGSGEATLVRKDGAERDFVYDWSLGRVAGRSLPPRFILVATDVTRLRHAEHELERQLRERDQFIASVSHELRTPLTSIMGLTEELVSRPGSFDADEQAELLEIVASETRDVVDIVEDLLVTARAEAGQLTMSLERCDLGAEAQRVGDLLGGIPTAAESVWTCADPGRLRQVLRNLVSNAHRHGGDEVRIIVRRETELAVAEVRDTGDPLPPQVRDRIFEPYERVGIRSPVGSVGLGLHVARLLARLMDGDLSYDHDGTETVFRLELPASNKELDVGIGGEVEESGRAGDVASLDKV